MAEEKDSKKEKIMEPKKEISKEGVPPIISEMFDTVKGLTETVAKIAEKLIPATPPKEKNGGGEKSFWDFS